jgi:hypothetical protein
MTDPDEHLDDLASAYLDGVATPAESARVEADADLMARVGRLRDLQTAVQGVDPYPVDEARREAAIAAARQAFDEPATVAPMTAARSWPASRRTLAVMGVAAAIVLLALVLPLLDRLSTDSPQQRRDEEAATAMESARDDAAAGSSDAAQPDAPDAPADLGPFRDVTDLTAAVRLAIEQPGTERADPTTSALASGTTAAEGAAECSEVDDHAPRLYSAWAEVAGRPVIVVVHGGGTAGDRELLVLDRADCTVVVRTPL